MFIGEIHEVGTIEPLVMPRVVPDRPEETGPVTPAEEPAREPITTG
ncbi:MAG TPA: hypothetical protein VFR44_05290 [Actinomycetota bacterium]|nr:hypothetical protein [Actinomycetota bacterium]